MRSMTRKEELVRVQTDFLRRLSGLVPCTMQGHMGAWRLPLRACTARLRNVGSATHRSYGTPPRHSSGRGAVLAVLPAIPARLADAPTTHGASGPVDCNAASLGHWDGLLWADGVAHRLIMLMLGSGAHDASGGRQVQILYDTCTPTSSASAPRCCRQRLQGDAAIHLGRIAVADPARRFL